MKRKSLIALLMIVSVLFVSVGKTQTLPLQKDCRYKMGDNIAWAAQFFNDSNWESRPLGTGFNGTNTKENFIWFRIKVLIPSSMKGLAEHGKGIQLYLGKIDDIDQTFFNGKLIGQTGSFPPAYLTQYQTNRQYVIPVNEVQWDKVNTIAIRVYSPDSWFGLYDGPYKFGPAQWSDFVTVKETITGIDNKSFISKVTFVNKRNTEFDGRIWYIVSDKNHRQLFSESKPVHIKPIIGDEQEISFSQYKTENEKIVRVSFLVKENETTAAISSEQLYLVDKKLKLEVKEEPKPVVVNKIKDLYSSLDFKKQQMQGYLGNRMNQNLVERLLKVDEPGTMDGYLERPGHHPWAGEHVGKYLESASNVWKNTGNEKLKMQMDQMAFQLINAQLADGYLGTYAPEDYWTSWDVWSHKYNLYGLLAYYKNTGYQPALEACKKMGDLLCNTFGNKLRQRDIILAGTHIGMAATSVLDPMVELYKYTGDKKYLDFCYYILDAWEHSNGPKIISALITTGKVTKVGNGKAYEMLSNFVGLVNLYKVTGDENLLKPALIAWQDIVSNRLYITGTTSSREYFQEDQILPAGKNDNIGEGCVTTTWIQFNQDLFSITGNLKYLEQIEKSIYNHLLAAENPESGCVSYYTSLMDPKPYSCEITCCTSSVPRGIAMIPYFGFGKVNSIPSLLLYERASYQSGTSTNDKKIIPLNVQVETGYPENAATTITLSGFQAASFSFALRVPNWAESYTAKVGDKIYKGVADQYLVIDRNWKAGDKIHVDFDISTKVLFGGISYPGKISFQRGAQVLALDESLNTTSVNDLLTAGSLKISENKLANSNIQILPKQWIGKQFYTVQTSNTKSEKANAFLILVPFADASQTGGAIKVWLPSK